MSSEYPTLAMTEQEAAKSLQDLTDYVKAMKPLRRADIEKLERKAYRTNPDLQRLDKEIKNLKVIQAVFEGTLRRPTK